jgi:hypothetical protein
MKLKPIENRRNTDLINAITIREDLRGAICKVEMMWEENDQTII